MPVHSSQFVSEVMSRYDRNRNGTIEMDAPQPKGVLGKVVAALTGNPGEQVATTHSSQTLADGKTVRTRNTTSHADLFRHADRNGDRKVERAELESYVQRYADKNGNLYSRGIWGTLRGRPKGGLDHLRDMEQHKSGGAHIFEKNGALTSSASTDPVVTAVNLAVNAHRRGR